MIDTSQGVETEEQTEKDIIDFDVLQTNNDEKHQQQQKNKNENNSESSEESKSQLIDLKNLTEKNFKLTHPYLFQNIKKNY